MTHIKNHFVKLIQKIDGLEERDLKDNGYTEKVKKLRILSELMKEQIKNANTSHTTR
jgi:hypothetical protein